MAKVFTSHGYLHIGLNSEEADLLALIVDAVWWAWDEGSPGELARNLGMDLVREGHAVSMGAFRRAIRGSRVQYLPREERRQNSLNE